MNQSAACSCVFPGPEEQELLTIPGGAPGTALRVYLEAGQDGYVRLQQLCYGRGVGWHVQKTMVIPGQMLEMLIPQLRKAQCLIPAGAEPPRDNLSVPFMRLTQDSAGASTQPTVQLKRA